MNAAANGHSKCVQILIKKGADVNQSDGNDTTALMSAAHLGHRRCMLLLLGAGADVKK